MMPWRQKTHCLRNRHREHHRINLVAVDRPPGASAAGCDVFDVVRVHESGKVRGEVVDQAPEAACCGVPHRPARRPPGALEIDHGQGVGPRAGEPTRDPVGNDGAEVRMSGGQVGGTDVDRASVVGQTGVTQGLHRHPTPDAVPAVVHDNVNARAVKCSRTCDPGDAGTDDAHPGSTHGVSTARSAALERISGR